MKTLMVGIKSSAPRLRRIRTWFAGTSVALVCSSVYALPRVGGAGAAGMQDIRDIRPPFHFSQEWLWLIGILAWCLLSLLAAAVWSWWRRRALAGRLAAHEVALARLLGTRSLMAPEHARAFSIAVSDIIRNYVELRFEIRAAHRTTPEFLRDCLSEADGLLAPHRQPLELFLRHCDLAKFARWVLSVPEMEDMLASAVDFVTETAHCTRTTQRPAQMTGDGGPLPAPEASAS